MKTYSPFYSPFVNRFDPESSRRVKTKDKEERIYRSTVPLFINNDSKRGRGCTNRAQLLPNVTKRERKRGGRDSFRQSRRPGAETQVASFSFQILPSSIRSHDGIFFCRENINVTRIDRWLVQTSSIALPLST